MLRADLGGQTREALAAHNVRGLVDAAGWPFAGGH